MQRLNKQFSIKRCTHFRLIKFVVRLIIYILKMQVCYRWGCQSAVLLNKESCLMALGYLIQLFFILSIEVALRASHFKSWSPQWKEKIIAILLIRKIKLWIKTMYCIETTYTFDPVTRTLTLGLKEQRCNEDWGQRSPSAVVSVSQKNAKF